MPAKTRKWQEDLLTLIESSFRQRATWAGLLFTLGAAAVGVLAFATGNNIMFLVLGLLLATLLVSGMSNRLNMASLDIEFLAPEHVFADSPTPASVRIKNDKLLFDSFGLHAQGRSQNGVQFYALFDWIGGRKIATRRGELIIKKRGQYTTPIITLWSRFPFGFTIRFQPITLEQPLTVYPALRKDPVMQNVIAHIDQNISRRKLMPSDEWHQIRPYQTTDPLNRIDWKATARTSTMHSREYASLEQPQIRIRLDRRADSQQTGQFEEAVSTCATALMYCSEQQIEVVLETQTDWFQILGLPSLYTGLRYLATVQPDATLPPFPAHEESIRGPFDVDLMLSASAVDHVSQRSES